MQYLTSQHKVPLSLILRALITIKNKGRENSILPPIRRIIPRIKDKIINKPLTALAIFVVFALINHERNKKIITKIIVPIIKIFI